MASPAGLVERAANSPEELAFLRAVVAAPADDLPRLVYADWLEERADPRGRLLRECVEASRADGEFPDLGDVPAPWADLTGLSVMASLARAGLLKHRDELLRHARPALRLDVGPADYENPPPAPAELGTTRLGGDPDLVAGEPYPVDLDGTPLYFLGQFDLADFAGTVAASAFPPAGLLSIFRQPIGRDDYPWRNSYNYHAPAGRLPSLARLVPPLAELMRLAPAAPAEAPGPYRPGLRVVETLRTPNEGHEWPGVTMTSEEYYAANDTDWCDASERFVLLGHATHRNNGPELLANRPDWAQLVLVPYYELLDPGDTQMSLSYILPAADLKAGRFDRLEASFG